MSMARLALSVLRRKAITFSGEGSLPVTSRVTRRMNSSSPVILAGATLAFRSEASIRRSTASASRATFRTVRWGLPVLARTSASVISLRGSAAAFFSVFRDADSSLRSLRMAVASAILSELTSARATAVSAGPGLGASSTEAITEVEPAVSARPRR